MSILHPAETPSVASLAQRARHHQSGALQQVLLERIFQSRPHDPVFTEADLSGSGGVAKDAVREFLIDLSSYGLIEREGTRGWRLCPYDPDDAQELAEARDAFEFKAIERLVALPSEAPAFAHVQAMLGRAAVLLAQPSPDHASLAALDREFHGFLIGLLHNRFAEQLNEVVSMVFHQHYQSMAGAGSGGGWPTEGQGVLAQGAHAQMAILQALAARDLAGAQAAMQRHLDSARAAMLRSLG